MHRAAAPAPSLSIPAAGCNQNRKDAIPNLILNIVVRRPIVFENGEVVVRRRGIDRLRRGHLWIYRSDIVTTRNAEPGSIVRVLDERGIVAGKAFYSSRSQIALRLLARGDAVIDEEFFRK